MITRTAALLRDFSIRTRMAGAIVVVLALFLVFAAVGVGLGHRIQSLNTHFIEHSITESGHVADIRALLGDVRVAEKNMVIDYDQPGQLKLHRNTWERAARSLREALLAMTEGEEDEDNPHARDAVQRLDEYLVATGKGIEAAEAGAYDGHRALDRVLERPKVLMAGIVEHVAAIDRIVKDEANETQKEILAAADEALLAFVVTLVLVVSIVVPLTLMNSRSIVQPIDSARRVADSIAHGDLSTRIDVAGRDEAADLMRALQTMQKSLQGMVGQIRDSAESISVSSSQIASGNQDLSSRTEQTSSNLQHAASSMVQVTGTVGQTAESARTANQLATSAAEAAQRGGSVVSQVITSMDEINDASRRIAEIIGVIDGIAFQTNILALNAAVEAARAGEQGRGFAVVAGEVRSLAQRSANAAREIKGLIGASVDKVESGSRLVHEAGSTMTELVAGVQRVSDIIGEITAATTEQSQELGQVNGAVTQLDQMTQQNAALVEQSAAAAESLREQAQRLSGVVAQFRLDRDAVSAPAAATPPTPPRATPVAPVSRPQASIPAARKTTAHKAAVPKAVPIRPAAPAVAAGAAAPARPVASVAASSDDDWTTF